MARLTFFRIAAPALTVALLTAACGSGRPEHRPERRRGGDSPRIAAIFSGSATDADYNALGLLALQSAEKSQGAETAHSESVPVPDAERVMKEYLADGYTVIWSHGSQYFEATSKLAKQNPDVTFIGEFDDKPKESIPNLWVLDRNFHTAFYPLGVLAAAQTKSGKIGYVGGLSLPFSYSEVHAVNQALKDSGSNATVTPVWTGDFNDPTKAQQITSQLVGQGNDVIVGSLNLGMVGAFQAVKGKTDDVVVTAKYTDKSQFDPEHYADGGDLRLHQAARRHAHQDQGRRAQRLLPARVRHGGLDPDAEERRSCRRGQGGAGRRRHHVGQDHGREEPHPDQVTTRS